MRDVIDDLSVIINNVRYTDEPDYRYVIPASWMMKMLDILEQYLICLIQLARRIEVIQGR